MALEHLRLHQTAATQVGAQVLTMAADPRATQISVLTLADRYAYTAHKGFLSLFGSWLNTSISTIVSHETLKRVSLVLLLAYQSRHNLQT
jgi:hypothetical protein